MLTSSVKAFTFCLSSAIAASVETRRDVTSDLRAELFWRASIAVPAALKAELSSAISAAFEAIPSCAPLSLPVKVLTSSVRLFTFCLSSAIAASVETRRDVTSDLRAELF